jgi:hypothetical protein
VECSSTPARVGCPDGSEKLCRCDSASNSHWVPPSCP